jgi:hypothetical protein
MDAQPKDGAAVAPVDDAGGLGALEAHVHGEAALVKDGHSSPHLDGLVPTGEVSLQRLGRQLAQTSPASKDVFQDLRACLDDLGAG